MFSGVVYFDDGISSMWLFLHSFLSRWSILSYDYAALWPHNAAGFMLPLDGISVIGRGAFWRNTLFVAIPLVGLFGWWGFAGVFSLWEVCPWQALPDNWSVSVNEGGSLRYLLSDGLLTSAVRLLSSCSTMCCTVSGFSWGPLRFFPLFCLVLLQLCCYSKCFQARANCTDLVESRAMFREKEEKKSLVLLWATKSTR